MSEPKKGNPLLDAVGVPCEVTLIAREGREPDIKVTWCGVEVATLEQKEGEVWVKE